MTVPAADARLRRYHPQWQAAREWLYRRRAQAPVGADIWHLRFHWHQTGTSLWQEVLHGEYRLSPMQVVRSATAAQESVAQWTAPDALVLKWVALVITDRLPVQPQCTHVAGRRGGRDALADITAHLQSGMSHMWRTDIRGYYRHINKQQLYRHLCRFVAEPELQVLLRQYIWYSVEQGGEFHTPAAGICRGCALSPLVGASFLWYVDSALSGIPDLFYVRYMDDFLVMSARRWQVRKARVRLHEYFDACDFECHPDKTQVGRTRNGFDWPGIWFTERGPAGMAPRALMNHETRRLNLHQRLRRKRLTQEAVEERLIAYDTRWQSWADRQLLAAQGVTGPARQRLAEITDKQEK